MKNSVASAVATNASSEVSMYSGSFLAILCTFSTGSWSKEGDAGPVSMLLVLSFIGLVSAPTSGTSCLGLVLTCSLLLFFFTQFPCMKKKKKKKVNTIITIFFSFYCHLYIYKGIHRVLGSGHHDIGRRLPLLLGQRGRVDLFQKGLRLFFLQRFIVGQGQFLEQDLLDQRELAVQLRFRLELRQLVQILQRQLAVGQVIGVIVDDRFHQQPHLQVSPVHRVRLRSHGQVDQLQDGLRSRVVGPGLQPQHTGVATGPFHVPWGNLVEQPLHQLPIVPRQKQLALDLRPQPCLRHAVARRERPLRPRDDPFCDPGGLFTLGMCRHDRPVLEQLARKVLQQRVPVRLVPGQLSSNTHRHPFSLDCAFPSSNTLPKNTHWSAQFYLVISLFDS